MRSFLELAGGHVNWLREVLQCLVNGLKSEFRQAEFAGLACIDLMVRSSEKCILGRLPFRKLFIPGRPGGARVVSGAEKKII